MSHKFKKFYWVLIFNPRNYKLEGKILPSYLYKPETWPNAMLLKLLLNLKRSTISYDTAIFRESA